MATFIITFLFFEIYFKYDLFRQALAGKEIKRPAELIQVYSCMIIL